MCNIRNILSTILLLFLFSCTYEEKPLQVKYVEVKNSSIDLIQGMPSIDITDGQELRIQLVTTGCFVDEDEPVISIKRKKKMYAVSFYSNGLTVLSNIMLDSSFKNQLKGFVNNCNRHMFNKKRLTDTSFSSLFQDKFSNREKIIISDGLHITGITLARSIKGNPFRELVSAIYWLGRNRHY